MTNTHINKAAASCEEKPRVAIAGAGPAGITAALELSRSRRFIPVVYESSDKIGGLSQTVNLEDNRIDIGGHRFFSKNDKVMKWWTDLLPLQTAPAHDEVLMGATASDREADPEKSDNVMLRRNRLSRIFFNEHFFDYPISLSFQTLKSLGLKTTLNAITGYLKSLILKLPEDNLENFYINRFGKPLYEMFFEHYTEKVWGIHPSKLSADWGYQRVKGLSIYAIIKDLVSKKLISQKNRKDVETSLIEEFLYPKFGPGQLWETAAEQAQDKGAIINLNHTVKTIHVSNNKVTALTFEDKNGELKTERCDVFLSSLPLREFVLSLEGVEVPQEIVRIAEGLSYRDFMTVGILVDKLTISNETRIKTFKNRIPDTWIYIQDRSVKIGRIQIFNNWSPYMVKDYENTVWLGLEYFCNEGDDLWQMSDEDFSDFAVTELESLKIIDRKDVLKTVRIRMKKAYPSYFGTYDEIDKLRNFLDGIENLYCIGRNGQHRYNNMDHSMLTAMEAVKVILNEKKDKSSIWNVNSEKDYCEDK